MSTTASIMGLIGWGAVVFAAAWIGSQYTPGAWYEKLRKPSWNPPNWLFAPVWTLLYIGMAVSAWLIWKEEGFGGAALPLALFILQLVLNAAWSWIFFGKHRLSAASGEILILWMAILATIITFGAVRPLAAWLLIPYLAWVTFASVLTLTVRRLNR